MNQIEKNFKESNNIERFAKTYFSYLASLFNQIDTKSIASFIEELKEAHKNQNTIFIIGNGGSAATASHMANDIGMDVLKKAKPQKAFRAMSLTDNASIMTAIANDDGYQNLFVNQLKIHYKDGDKLVIISASGNSQNLVEAAAWVKSKGGNVIGFLGFDGGKLKDICDLLVYVRTNQGEYGPVEDIHLIINHLVANWLQYSLRDQKQDCLEVKLK